MKEALNFIALTIGQAQEIIKEISSTLPASDFPNTFRNAYKLAASSVQAVNLEEYPNMASSKISIEASKAIKAAVDHLISLGNFREKMKKWCDAK